MACVAAVHAGEQHGRACIAGSDDARVRDSEITGLRRGIARALMVALEGVAQAEGWTLLTLDTWTGQAGERLYRSLGYTAVGTIPRFARGSTTPELEPTTIMYKELPGESR